MKKTFRLGALILSLMLVFSLFATAVFAEENVEAIAETENAVLAATEGDTAEAPADGSAEMSEEELQAALQEALAGSTAASLADTEVFEVTLPEFGLTMKVPAFATSISAASQSAEIQAALNVGLDSFLASGYLVYCVSADSSNIVYATYATSEYTKIIGSYDNLSDEELQSIMDTNTTNYSLAEGAIEVVEINGVKFIHMTITSENNNVEGTATSVVSSQMYSTVYNGIQYNIVLQFTDLTAEEDIAFVDSLAQSIKLSSPGLGYALAGGSTGALSTLEIVLLVIVILLVIVVGFLCYRVFDLGGQKKDSDDDEDFDDIDDDDADDEDSDDEE